MEKRRCFIEHNFLPQNAIARLSKPVRPRIQKRDSRAAPPCRGSFEVFHAPENLHAPMTKRSAEHAVSRQENGLEIARNEHASGWIKDVHSNLFVTPIGQIRNPNFEIRNKSKTRKYRKPKCWL